MCWNGSVGFYGVLVVGRYMSVLRLQLHVRSVGVAGYRSSGEGCVMFASLEQVSGRYRFVSWDWSVVGSTSCLFLF